MLKRFTLVFLFLIALPILGLSQLQTSRQDTILFADLGYTKAMVMRGTSPSELVSLVSPAVNSVNWSKSYLELRVESSGALNNSSSLTVKLDDIPIRTVPLSGEQEFTVIKIPLSRIASQRLISQRSGEALPMAFKFDANLSISHDPCADGSNAGTYILIQPESRIVFSRRTRTSPRHIAGFFYDLTDEVFIIPAGGASAELSEAVTILTGNLQAEFPKIRFTIADTETASNSKGQEIHVSLADKGEFNTLTLPNEVQSEETGAESGWIINRGNKLRLWGKNEVALMKAVKAITESTWRQTLTSRSVAVKIPPAGHTNPITFPARFSFESLNLGSPNFEGNGTIRQTYYLGMAGKGLFPENLQLHLYGEYTPVHEEEKVYLNIYWNQLLVESRALDHSGNLNHYAVTLPRYQIDGSNRLDIEFLYASSEDVCLSDNVFKAQIYSGSYVSVGGTELPTHRTFGLFPGAFVNGFDLVLKGESNIAQWQLAAAAIARTATWKERSVYPTINPKTLAEDRPRIIFADATSIRRQDLALLPIIYDDNIKLIRQDTKDVLFGVSDYGSAGTMAIGGTKKAVRMAFIARGEEGYHHLTNMLNQMPFRSTVMLGNIAFATAENAIGIHSNSITYAVVMPEEYDIYYYIRTYKGYGFISIWLLLAFGAVLLYNQTTKHVAARATS